MHDIAIRNLHKSFGRTEVLHGIDLNIAAGGFVGLMGPNGAGKSTLIKVLGGVHPASSGEIVFAGETVRSLSEKPEVGFVHQDLGLIDDLSIADNLRLGERPMRVVGPILDRRRERQAAQRALERTKLDRPVETLVGELSPGEKTLVAIARLLERGAKVLFIDEATSTLPPSDAKRLITALKQMMREEQATVIMVTHKLSEVLDATDRVVLLLDGVIAADIDSSELSRERLVSMLVEHEARAHVADEDDRTRREPGRALVRLEQVCGGRAGPVDLELHAGQVIGLTGLPGSGLHDVAHLVNGTMKPTKGHIERAEDVRVAFIPPHRETQGGFDDLSVLENLTISSMSRWRAPWRLLRKGSERKAAVEMIDRLHVKPDDPTAGFGTLSGGNKQKVIFGRVLLNEPNVFVLCEPTRGVDVGTRAEIYRLIRGLARHSECAVLVVTSDSEDLFAVCDRFAVLAGGKIADFVWADETNQHELEAFI